MTGGLVSEHQRSQHPCHERNGLHLGVVANLDNLEIIAAEGYCNGPADGHRPAYAQRQHEQERPQQSNKQIRCGALSKEQKIV